jgi:general secretion pathway protein K
MRTTRARERGVALLLVFWVLMLLGVLALDFSRYMRDDAMASVNLAEETRGYYIALAGINRAIYDAERVRERTAGVGGAAAAAAAANPPPDGDSADDDEPLVPPDGEWHEGDFAGGRWRVRMVDEAGRIPLNRVAPNVLARVVRNIVTGGDTTAGVDRRLQNEIDTIVDSIQDWRDRNHEAMAHGAENEFYLKRNPPYRAKNGPFDAPEELLLVRGVTPALFYGTKEMPGLRDVFSVYSKTAKLNAASAPPAVLRALLGNDAAADLIEQRENGAPIADLLKAQLLASGDPVLAGLIEADQAPRVVQIEALADVAQSRNQSHVALVADLASETSEGTRVIRWLDRAPWDGPVPQPARGEEDHG